MGHRGNLRTIRVYQQIEQIQCVQNLVNTMYKNQESHTATQTTMKANKAIFWAILRWTPK